VHIFGRRGVEFYNLRTRLSEIPSVLEPGFIQTLMTLPVAAMAQPRQKVRRQTDMQKLTQWTKEALVDPFKKKKDKPNTTGHVDNTAGHVDTQFANEEQESSTPFYGEQVPQNEAIDGDSPEGPDGEYDQQTPQFTGPTLPVGVKPTTVSPRPKEEPPQKVTTGITPGSPSKMCRDDTTCKFRMLREDNPDYLKHFQSYRHRCFYGGNCGKSDPNHRVQFSHEITLPWCPDKKSCKRMEDLEHRQQFAHPAHWDWLMPCKNHSAMKPCMNPNCDKKKYYHK